QKPAYDIFTLLEFRRVLFRSKKSMDSANEIAREIRQKIFDKTGLTASAGISINKFLAKVASDINKPNGQNTIHPEHVIEFLEDRSEERRVGKESRSRYIGCHK